MPAKYGQDDLLIEPLGSHHDRGAFRCGRQRIDNFFKNNARADHNRYKVRVFVACEHGKKEVVGFYSLCLSTYDPERADPTAKEKFARVKAVPAIYLAMIGVSAAHQQRNAGLILMRDALQRALFISEHAGAYAVTLDAATEELCGWYGELGFKRIEEGERALYLPLSILRKAL